MAYGGVFRVGMSRGLKGAEALLAQLQGVVSARIEAAEDGALRHVHVLVTPDRPAKQLVRDIESALFSQLGERIDHRKISLAQLDAGPSANDVFLSTRVRFSTLRLHEVADFKCRAEVVLGINGTPYQGETSDTDTPVNRLKVSARATLDALEAFLGGEGTFHLSGVRIVEAFDREVAVVSVRTVTDRGTLHLVGSCVAEDDPWRAAVLATLNATNRYLARFISKFADSQKGAGKGKG